MKRILYLCVVSITAHCYAERAVPKERETLLSLLEEIPPAPIPKTLPPEISAPAITQEKIEKQPKQPELANYQSKSFLLFLLKQVLDEKYLKNSHLSSPQR